MAVDHPLVALAHGRGLNGSGVRARVLGFGHGEARLHGPLDQREQPLALLLLGAVLDQDGLVARVRGDHAEERGRTDGVGQDLVHVGVRHEVEAHPAVLGREVGGPQPLGLDRVLHLVAQGLGLGPLLVAGEPRRPLQSRDSLGRISSLTMRPVLMRMSLMWSLSPAMGVTVMGMGPPAVCVSVVCPADLTQDRRYRPRPATQRPVRARS